MLNEIDEQTISLSATDDIPHEVQLADKHWKQSGQEKLEALEI